MGARRRTKANTLVMLLVGGAIAANGCSDGGTGDADSDDLSGGSGKIAGAAGRPSGGMSGAYSTGGAAGDAESGAGGYVDPGPGGTSGAGGTSCSGSCVEPSAGSSGFGWAGAGNGGAGSGGESPGGQGGAIACSSGECAGAGGETAGSGGDGGEVTAETIDPVLGCPRAALPLDATFRTIGSLQQDELYRSAAQQVSGDGRVVVGSAHWGYDSGTNSARFNPIIWTAENGLELIDDREGGGWLEATNCDGSLAVGVYGRSSGFRWSRNEGDVPLQLLPGGSYAGATVNATGFVVGTANTSVGNYVPTRWLLDGAADRFYPAFLSGSAQYASLDGTTICGHAVWYDEVEETETRALFCWAEAIGLARVGTLGAFEPRGWSADGRVIHGVALGRVTLWVPGISYSILPCEGLVCDTSLVSSRASVVVYREVATDGLSSRPLVWDAKHGARPLITVLTGLGIDLGEWQNLYPTGISHDARVIVGQATTASGRSEGFYATLPPTAFD